MYGDQLGEFVCGYWGLKCKLPGLFGNVPLSLIKRPF